MVVKVPGHLDVTILTSIGAPAILNQPVVLTVLSTVPDNQYTDNLWKEPELIFFFVLK